ncbi:MAG: CAP domain-containing protein [Sphingobacteriaceae bacterium]|nr:MAG: CAP domain-containing protein [Sphingobacteriaceae bacterium]
MKFILGTILTTIGLITLSSFILPKADKKFKQEFLEIINRTRTKGCKCGNTKMPPAPPLVWNDILEDAAMTHAKDMAKRKYFSHTGKDGRSSSDRIMDAGYKFDGYQSYLAGENIAFGQESIEEVMTGWFKSEGHCKNLMNAGFKEVGVAMYNNYWVQEFGGREEFSKEQQKLMKSGKYRIIQKKVIQHE